MVIICNSLVTINSRDYQRGGGIIEMDKETYPTWPWVLMQGPPPLLAHQHHVWWMHCTPHC